MLIKIILSLSLFLISSCSSPKMVNSKDFFRKINITLELKKCIDIDRENQVTFIIRNDGDIGFWIHSWHLMLDSITTKDGINIPPNNLIEYEAPEIPEYSWVNPNSELKVSYNTNFFKRFSLSKLTEYYLFSSYTKYARPKRQSKEITLIFPMNIYKIDFWTCP